jgi:hypothetical protein
MIPQLEDAVTHPSCLMVEPVDDPDTAFSELLRSQLLEIIYWQANRHPRNSQLNIGPSEVGNPCDRHIGYRLSQIPEINNVVDPWASTVGTAIHTWLEKAIADWMLDTGQPIWETEAELSLGAFVTGHSDLYSYEHQAVIDWKTVGVDMLRQVENGGIPDGYKIQAHIYGLMFRKAGKPVRRVALAFVPRANLLRRTVVWSALYDEAVARTALSRVFKIAGEVVALDPLSEGNGHRWEQLPATTGKHCGLCPWYDSRRDPDLGADSTGCPGGR